MGAAEPFIAYDERGNPIDRTEPPRPSLGAGWYPAPRDGKRQRYYDGVEWTPSYRDRPTPFLTTFAWLFAIVIPIVGLILGLVLLVRGKTSQAVGVLIVATIMVVLGVHFVIFLS
jgi:hypothetical protein